MPKIKSSIHHDGKEYKIGQECPKELVQHFSKLGVLEKEQPKEEKKPEVKPDPVAKETK